jgi:hypothetical protein
MSDPAPASNFFRTYNLNEARLATQQRSVAPHQQEALTRLGAWYRSSVDQAGTILEFGEDGERPLEWAIRLNPGNTAAWAEPHLDVLLRQIRLACEMAGFAGLPDRIILNTPQTRSQDSPHEADVSLEHVLHSIEEVEGFRIRVSYRDGRKVRGDLTKDIRPYPYQNALNGEKTVGAWKSARFLPCYEMFDTPDFVVQVIDGVGDPSASHRKLRNVRASYRYA